MKLNFKEWLLQEMGDILNRDVSHVNLQPHGNGYYYVFEIDGAQFTVKFDLTTDYTFQVKNIYSITFEGPNGYNSTGKSGTTANVIYAELLMAIKKLFETTQVNGLTFSPAEPQMGLVYRRFFNQYLKKDFINAAPKLFLRKTILRDILNKQNKADREDNLRNILRTGRDTLNRAKEVKANRLKVLTLKKLINSFVVFDSYNDGHRVGYLQSIIDQAEARLMYTNSIGTVAHSDLFSLDRIDITKKPSTEEITATLKVFANFRKNRYIKSYVEKDDKLKELFKQYNIEITSEAEEMKKHVNQFFKDDYNDYIYYVHKIDESHQQYVVLTEENKRIDSTHLGINSIENMIPVSEDDVYYIQRFLSVASDPERHNDHHVMPIIESDKYLQKLFVTHNIKPKEIREVNFNEYINKFFRLESNNATGIFYVYEAIVGTPNKMRILILDENHFYSEVLYFSDFKDHATNDVTQEEINQFLSSIAEDKYNYQIRDALETNSKLREILKNYEDNLQ